MAYLNSVDLKSKIKTFGDENPKGGVECRFFQFYFYHPAIKYLNKFIYRKRD